MDNKLAVIGGTGMGTLVRDCDSVREQVVGAAPYGAQVHFLEVQHGGAEFIFVDRHRASGSFLLPHQLEHTATMFVLTQELGRRFFVPTSAVGGARDTRESMALGALFTPDDLIDFTNGVWTFARDRWTHPTAFHRAPVQPFCPHLRALLRSKIPGLHDGGTLGVCVRGPRYETAAEVRRHIKDGIQFLGMPTTGPETFLAREASRHYAVICCVTDLVPVLADEEVDGDGVDKIAAAQQQKILTAILELAKMPDLGAGWTCSCTKDPSVFDSMGTQPLS